MVHKKSLPIAIVIPAYKSNYLAETLKALVNQTVRDFNVYIGDDNSPDNIEQIVAPFYSLLNIFYKKFEYNLGHKSLVGQWHRCIDLTKSEPWIWLLPDDDVPEETCVERFLIKQNEKRLYQVYRFRTNHIDENGKIIKINSIPPEIETGIDFIINKLKFIRSSSVAEYIFSRSIYVRCGGFKDIPLAWGSDDLAWLTFSKEFGIYTISDALVRLRQSQINISNKDKLIKKRIDAHYYFFDELLDYIKTNKEILVRINIIDIKIIIKNHIFNELFELRKRINIKDIFLYAQKNKKLLGDSYFRNFYRLIYHLRIKTWISKY